MVHNRPKVMYGRVEKVIECQLPNSQIFGDFRGRLRLLALITPCKTDGRDATKELTFYETETAPIITDLATVRSVVGRVKTTLRPSTVRHHWSIIDRSTALARATFEEQVEEEGDSDSDNE